MIHCQLMVNGEAFLDEVIIYIHNFFVQRAKVILPLLILILVSSVLNLLLPYNVYFNSALYFQIIIMTEKFSILV